MERHQTKWKIHIKPTDKSQNKGKHCRVKKEKKKKENKVLTLENVTCKGREIWEETKQVLPPKPNLQVGET